MNNRFLCAITISTVVPMLTGCNLIQRTNIGSATSNQNAMQTATIATAASDAEYVAEVKAKTDKTVEPEKQVSAQKAVHATTEKDISDRQLRLSEQELAGEWTIYAVDGKQLENSGEEYPYVNFEINANRFYAFNGCNVLNGDFEIKTGQFIEFNNILATQRYCPEVTKEYAINLAFNNARSYSLDKRAQAIYMNIHDKSHRTVLTLRKHNLDYLNGMWKVVQIDNSVCLDADIQLLIDIPEGKLHGNTGCNVVNGTLFEEPDKEASIQFQNIVSTRAACENAERETALLIALEEVESVRVGRNKSVIMLDKNGKTKLILNRIASR